jgi:hypothetical protein
VANAECVIEDLQLLTFSTNRIRPANIQNLSDQPAESRGRGYTSIAVLEPLKELALMLLSSAFQGPISHYAGPNLVPEYVIFTSARARASPLDWESTIVQGLPFIKTQGLNDRITRDCEKRSTLEVWMKLTAPIFILKQQAKALSRREKIPLYEALDRIAAREGLNAWSLLAAKAVMDNPSARFLQQLRPGDLALIAARPGQGKTLLSLELAVQTMRQGNRAAFFTLESTQAAVAQLFKIMDEKVSNFTDRLLIDDSDEICADYIATRLASAPARMLVTIDYLQLLDQKRRNASLADQIQRLKTTARERQLIIVCLSQIDRRYDASKQPFPDFGDVRLPNPVDINLFNHACFLNRGKLQVAVPPA